MVRFVGKRAKAENKNNNDIVLTDDIMKDLLFL